MAVRPFLQITVIPQPLQGGAAVEWRRSRQRALYRGPVPQTRLTPLRISRNTILLGRIAVVVLVAGHIPDIRDAVVREDWWAVSQLGLMCCLFLATLGGSILLALAMALSAVGAALSLVTGHAYAAWLGFLIVAVAVGYRSRRGPKLVLVGLFTIWTVAICVLFPAGTSDSLLALTPTFAGFLAIGEVVGRTTRALAATTATLTETQSREQAARETERRALARELHHGATRNLAMATMLAAHLAQTRELEAAREIEDLCREANEDLRRLVGTLTHDDDAGRPPTPAPRRDIGAVLDVQTERLRRLGCSVTVRHDLGGSSGIVAETAARIIEEAVSNIAHHADPDATCTLEVFGDARSLQLRITSTLAATPRPPSTGLGLVALGERVESLGGTFTAGAVEGNWVVEARLPEGSPLATGPADSARLTPAEAAAQADAS